MSYEEPIQCVLLPVFKLKYWPLVKNCVCFKKFVQSNHVEFVNQSSKQLKLRGLYATILNDFSFTSPLAFKLGQNTYPRKSVFLNH